MIFQDDQERMGEILKATESVALQFLESLSTRPAGYVLQPLSHDVLPDEGVGALEALSQFRNKYEAQLSGSPGPRYLGFVTGGSTPAAIAGDWLTSAYDQNVGSDGDSIATTVERETLRMLRDFSLFLSSLRGYLSVARHKRTWSRLPRHASGQHSEWVSMSPNMDSGICLLFQ